MKSIDVTELPLWAGRIERRNDVIATAPLAALAAILNRPEHFTLGSDVPPLWHWLSFIPLARRQEIGQDGHPRRGGFLPPVPLPRRMWAGGELQFHHPLQVGDEVSRQSSISSVDVKAGKSGALVFVKVRHQIENAKGVAIAEEQDIVYRDAPQPGAVVPAPRMASFDEHYSETIRPDPVLLFQYSALTFNGHPIHYDRPYGTVEERYPRLVVHAPLIATMLLELACRRIPARAVRRFKFKAVHPLFDIAAFAVCGQARPDGSHLLWARSQEGVLAMEASVEFN